MSTIAAGTTSTTALVSTGDTTGKLVLQTNGTTDAVTIDTSQRVGIGTSSPSSKLHVVGSQFRLQTDNCSHQFYNTAGSRYAYLEAASGGVVLDVESGGGSKFIVRSSGSEKIQVNQYGLCFNGDTAAANALDDYEEGTWTPTLTADTTAPTVTYTSQIGSYRKIGSQVIVEFNLSYSGRSGGSGTAWVGGLPFQAFSHSPDSRAFEAIAVWGGPSFTGVIFGIVGGSSTNIIMYYILSGNANAQDISSMSTSGSIRGVFSYITS